MKVVDLKSLMQKVQKFARTSKVRQHYEAFVNTLNQNLRTGSKQPVAPHKDTLFKTLREFDSDALPYSERKLFETLNVGEFLGPQATQEIDNILRDDKFDPAGVVQRIQELYQKTTKFYDTAETLVTALAALGSQEQSVLNQDEALLQIIFEDKAAIDNIVDFEKWIDIWSKIVRSFGLLVGRAPESARVVFVQKSSPMIMEIATYTGIALALGKASNLVLEQVERYLRIRKQIVEIRRLKLKNKQIEKELEKEAEDFRENSSKKIAHDVVKTTDKDKLKEGETVTALEMSIGNLFVFIDSGGKVDCKTDRKPETEMDKLLAQVFSAVRGLERKVDDIRLLPEQASTIEPEK